MTSAANLCHTIEMGRQIEKPPLFPDMLMPYKSRSMTYGNQPGIAASKGHVPQAGTSHIYRVNRLLWPEAVESFIATLLISNCLHVCCGKSLLGDVRCDIDPANKPDVVADASHLPFGDGAFESVLCDPPYNGKMQWQHDLLNELSRVAARRIVFQHWFVPVDIDGCWRKWDRFKLTGLYAWSPRSYFGRVQMVSVFDVIMPDGPGIAVPFAGGDIIHQSSSSVGMPPPAPRIDVVIDGSVARALALLPDA